MNKSTKMIENKTTFCRYCKGTLSSFIPLHMLLNAHLSCYQEIQEYEPEINQVDYRCFTCKSIFSADPSLEVRLTCPKGHINLYWANKKDDLNA